MVRGRDGFTLVELMISMVITMIVITMATTVLTSLITQFKQQSKVAETSVETVVGLELFRRDLGVAGFGLPGNVGALDYTEATAGVANNYDDDPDVPPRALVSGNNVAFANIVAGSDYVVIKSIAVARNEATGKVHTLRFGDEKNVWYPLERNENLMGGERVIVLRNDTAADVFDLVMDGGNFAPLYNGTANYAPQVGQTKYETRYVFGVRPDNTPLSFPFNRADYYVSTVDVPERCAPGTGVLVKAVLQHDTNALGQELPLLDCVATMQIVYRLDNNEDGEVETTSDDISTLDASQIRRRLKEVRVAVLAHEGQRDPNYVHASTIMTVGTTAFDITTLGAEATSYRWKVHSFSEAPRTWRQP